MHPKESTQDPFIRDDLRREIISIQFSGNLVVVKTKMGYAPGIAYAIDQLKVSEVLGTVGGDDTLLVVLKEGADRAKFLRAVTGEVVSLSGRATLTRALRPNRVGESRESRVAVGLRQSRYARLVLRPSATRSAARCRASVFRGAKRLRDVA